MVEYPVTTAVRHLREKKVHFEPFLYAYEEHGGTRRASAELGVDEHAVIKTLVFQTDARTPVLVLMHGDREVSAKNLARQLNVKAVAPADPAAAQRWTGYQVGGISPFGTRTRMPVYVEESILALEAILLNGGKRGFLVRITPEALTTVLGAQPVQVGIVDG